MRVPKEISAWFKVPDDPDESEFKFKLLNPGEASEVQDAAFEVKVEFEDDGGGKRFGKATSKKGKEKEVYLSLQGWKKVFDRDGSELEYSKGNKLRPMRECDGFYEFFGECQEKLLEIKKGQEKNSPGTAKGSKKSQSAEHAKS